MTETKSLTARQKKKAAPPPPPERWYDYDFDFEHGESRAAAHQPSAVEDGEPEPNEFL
jgi:hypothetical protein